MALLLTLPRDMLVQILFFLPLKDLNRISTVNRLMRELSQVDHLWKNLLEQDCAQMKLDQPTKPSDQSWKDYYKTKIYFKTFIEGGTSISRNKNTAESTVSKIEMVFGRFHYSGKHKYTIKVHERGYVGIGVASNALTQQEIVGGEKLAHTPGCSVYYYTGVWYGWKEQKNPRGFLQGVILNAEDVIDVSFNVDNGEVEYVRETKTLGVCQVNQGYDLKRGLRLGVVLSKPGSVTIIDYQSC
eukprot:TRINITY_DN1379_c0_g1_i11.p1 TRINITY_DN1379_c0_g1~~TRINITY_DN1379_c0_g1_i11.p1  ORF type:complete len:242 (+),score=37.66 TRINITY_DN1379_c0_g1_i11:86-811(+)